jgi:hypothetical protein
LESETMDSKPVTLQKLQWISIDHIYWARYYLSWYSSPIQREYSFNYLRKDTLTLAFANEGQTYNTQYSLKEFSPYPEFG